MAKRQEVRLVANFTVNRLDVLGVLIGRMLATHSR